MSANPSAVPVATESKTTQLTLPVEGMTCASCVARVERALLKVPNVVSASVNWATEQATVTGLASTADLFAAVEDAGYEPQALAAASSAN